MNELTATAIALVVGCVIIFYATMWAHLRSIKKHDPEVYRIMKERKKHWWMPC